jgi:Tol biopolymer transport system component
MTTSSRWYLAAGLLLLATGLPPKSQEPAALPSFATPGISPDGSEIAFVSGGDIWTVPAAGGEARLLVSHPAVESRPLYSPDGKELAFNSTRAGSADVWVLTLGTGALRRLTFEDGAEQLDAWSPDGQWLYYSSSSRDISGMNDEYKVRATGGTPVAVSADRYASEYWAAPSPDGRVLAITARGVSAGQWWRKGSSHLDQSQIILVHPGAPPTYDPLTDGTAREGWPMWSADGAALWYVSDRGGAQNVWTRPVHGAARQVTAFKDGRVLWPSISRDGKRIAFERDFEIWTLETASGRAQRVPIERRGAGSEPTGERMTFTSQIQEMALAPDAKKIAFVVHGEIFAASARDGGMAARVTRSPAVEEEIAWSPDSRRLVYVSERGGGSNLYLYDFLSGAESRLTDQPLNDATPRFSPDGKQVAFVRDGHELRVVDLEGRKERVVATGVLGRQRFSSARGFAWSPDGKWIAFLDTGAKGFTNAFLVPSAGGERRQVTFLANAFAGAVSWSPSGSFLLVNSGQRTEPGTLARVDLVPRTPRFREDQFRDLFIQETPRQPRSTPAPAPAEAPPQPAASRRDSIPPAPLVYEFGEIRRRLSLIPVGLDVNDQIISPDGKTAIIVASVAGRSNIYSWPLDELSTDEQVAKQLTSTAGAKRDIAFSPDGKEIFYREQGRISAVNVESRQVRAIAVTAELDVDFEQEKMEVFRQAWSLQRDNYYDPAYHGADWEAVRREYEPRIAGARTPDEMRRILNFMVGELNSSHSGINAPPPATPITPTGRLGLRFDPAELENGGTLKVSEVIPLSPAAIGGIKPGEWVLAVDGERIGKNTNLDEVLFGKVGRRVALRVGSSASDAGREVLVRPVNTGAEKELLYRAWVEDRRAYVARASDGRLGYVHLPDMSEATLAQLAVDLDTENQGRDGVVIDIRNNNGGFVNAYALDIFARRPYLIMQPRGGVASPARSQLGQRALERPTVLVTNQHSLSDAEDFTQGYRELGLGKVVGEPTAGWIIYTGGTTLLDGTGMRMPFIRITAPDGQDMELHPRAVDVRVDRPVGEWYSGKDAQLDAAVKTLLEQIGKKS